ncbi:MAG: MNIO family bufferin maturase [Polyangiaceae bacterium]
MGFRREHSIPDLGVGVGFRRPHVTGVLRDRPSMDWFEVISENYLGEGGALRANLEALRSTYRVVPHGVSLSIGGTDPLDLDLLTRLASLVRRIDAPWCSDHLCWTGLAGVDVHDLLPLPFTRRTLEHVVERVKRVQGTLGVPFALENASSYMEYAESTMPEHAFLAELAERADCGVLLDVNNVYVNAHNHGFDAEAYVDAVPAERVVQIHLAGHADRGAYLLDTHGDHVKAEVWELYRRAIRRCGPVSTLIEWDEDIPPWDVLSAEARIARRVRHEVLSTAKAEATWAATT